MADQAQETPESRLYTAGFTRQLEFWVTPDGERVLNLNDALAALDAGEVKPAVLEIPARPDQPGFRELTAEAVDAMAERLFRPAPPPPPDWLEPLAELVVQKLNQRSGPRSVRRWGPRPADGHGSRRRERAGSPRGSRESLA
jgi:hypothetical protein